MLYSIFKKAKFAAIFHGKNSFAKDFNKRDVFYVHKFPWK